MERALIEAAENNNLDGVRRLLEAGVNVHAKNDKALRSAAENGYTEVVQLLLEFGANVHAREDEALRNTADNGYTEVVRLLLDAGANVHAREDEALRDAAENGYTEVVQLLLEFGADVHAVVDYALRGAADNGHTEVVRLLLDANANVHADDDYALRGAAENEFVEIVRLLLQAGANVGVLDDEIFEGLNNRELLALLREHGANISVPVSVEERRRAALEQEQKNEQLRIAALDEVKNREEKAPENPFIEAHCSSSENLYGDPLKDTDDIVVFDFGGTKGDCYLKEELKLLRSDQYVRGVGEKAYKLPWSNVWITKTLKEFAENMHGYGPIPLQRSENFVGHNRNNILWIS